MSALSRGKRGESGRRCDYEGIDQFYRFTFQYLDNPDYNPEKDNEAKQTICQFRNIGRHEIIDTAP